MTRTTTANPHASTPWRWQALCGSHLSHAKDFECLHWRASPCNFGRTLRSKGSLSCPHPYFANRPARCHTASWQSGTCNTGSTPTSTIQWNLLWISERQGSHSTTWSHVAACMSPEEAAKTMSSLAFAAGFLWTLHFNASSMGACMETSSHKSCERLPTAPSMKKYRSSPAIRPSSLQLACMLATSSVSLNLCFSVSLFLCICCASLFVGSFVGLLVCSFTFCFTCHYMTISLSFIQLLPVKESVPVTSSKHRGRMRPRLAPGNGAQWPKTHRPRCRSAAPRLA